ncbi:MAG: hypothetical protein WCG47_12810, partial [Dermatophilaceae bacterium]
MSLLAVLAVSVVGLLGAGSPASSVRLLRAGAWLQNAVNGTVSQINGYSGKASSQVRVATDSQDFHVVQRDDGAYVVDDHTGAVARVDPSQLTVGPAVAAFGAAAGPVRVVVGGEHTWEVDPVKGAVVEVDPLSLQPKGPVLPVGGGVSGDPVADKEGHLWVYVTGSGSVTRVTPDLTVSTTEVGKPHDAVALTVADGAAVAYNASAGRVLPLPSGRAMDVPPDAAQAPVVAGDAAAPTVLTVGKQVVSAVRLGQDARTVPIGALDKVTKAVLAGDRGYLLDGATKQVTMVDFSAGNSQVMGFAPVDDLLVKDGVTFLNDAKRSKALAVRDNGELVDIEKYTEGSTTEASNPVPVTQRELPASAAGVAAAPSGRNTRPAVLPDLAAAPATAPPAASDATPQAPPPAPAAPAPGPE